jgi:hypothetical protein
LPLHILTQCAASTLNCKHGTNWQEKAHRFTATAHITKYKHKTHHITFGHSYAFVVQKSRTVYGDVFFV